jgi:hypothetical protein
MFLAVPKSSPYIEQINRELVRGLLLFVTKRELSFKIV